MTAGWCLDHLLPLLMESNTPQRTFHVFMGVFQEWKTPLSAFPKFIPPSNPNTSTCPQSRYFPAHRPQFCLGIRQLHCSGSLDPTHIKREHLIPVSQARDSCFPVGRGTWQVVQFWLMSCKEDWRNRVLLGKLSLPGIQGRGVLSYVLCELVMPKISTVIWPQKGQPETKANMPGRGEQKDRKSLGL